MKLYVLETTDPAFNLAAEEYLFQTLTEPVLILWRNKNAVIIGKNQNTLSEINMDEIRKNNVSVVRRMTGGGAVYHDLGNVNYSVIRRTGDDSLNFRVFSEPVIKALLALGVNASFSGRNDLVIDGKKISGCAQHSSDGKTLHHGTLLFSSELDVLGRLLTVDPEKIASKAIRSVRSRVTNIAEHLPENMTVEQFIAFLAQSFIEETGCVKTGLTVDEEKNIYKLADDKYRLWEWNYGYSPKYTFRKKLRTESGSYELRLETDGGIIKRTSFFGDYFAKKPITELETKLTGIPHREDAVRLFYVAEGVGDYLDLNEEQFTKLFF